MTVLVIGSTGLLGQAIVEEARVRALEPIGAARLGAELHLDLANDESLQRTLKEIGPSLIVNCAAITDLALCEADPGQSWRINARPLALLADWSRRLSAPLVQVSTDHFYTGDGNRAHREGEPVTLINDYARSKFAGEALALTAPNALVLRTSILGRRGWPQPTLAEWAHDGILRGTPLTLFEDAYTSSIDTGAFARAAFDLVERYAAGRLNLAARSVYSKGDFVRALARSLGRELVDTKSGTCQCLRPRRGDSLGLDVTAAESILGYQLPDLAAVVAAVAVQLEDTPQA